MTLYIFKRTIIFQNMHRDSMMFLNQYEINSNSSLASYQLFIYVSTNLIIKSLLPYTLT